MDFHYPCRRFVGLGTSHCCGPDQRTSLARRSKRELGRSNGRETIADYVVFAVFLGSPDDVGLDSAVEEAVTEERVWRCINHKNHVLSTTSVCISTL